MHTMTKRYGCRAVRRLAFGGLSGVVCVQANPDERRSTAYPYNEVEQIEL